MRIGIAGILNKPIIANSLGGTEEFTYQLCQQLVKRGHKVTLFATQDSKTSAKIEPTISSKKIKGIIESGIEVRFLYHLLQAREIAKKSSNFDIIHNNYYDSFLLMPFVDWFKCPVVTTVHNDFWQFKNMRYFFQKTQRSEKDLMVFVSKMAKNLAHDPKDSAVIYNGIEIKNYPFMEENSQKYLFWLSRFAKEKGPAQAIEVALETKNPIILAGGSPQTQELTSYYAHYVRPYLSETIQFLGPQDAQTKVRLYQEARAFLFPIQWEEPFGLVMIEAMATGTPVVTFARGSIPEVVKDGVTGFVVNPSDEDIRGDWIIKKTGTEGLSEAVERIYSMSDSDYKIMRENCRTRVEKNFAVERMVDEYEKVYQKILEGHSRKK